MIFVIMFLVVKYSSIIKMGDRIFKGALISTTLLLCLYMSAGSGVCINPAIATSATIY